LSKKTRGIAVDKLDLASVAQYYTDRLTKYGATPMGVDWKDQETHQIRFGSFDRLFPSHLPGFSVLDFGSGYGAYADYLFQKELEFEYLGYDLSREMCIEGTRLFSNRTGVQFSSELPKNAVADFVIACGTFNVKLDYDHKEWKEMLFEKLEFLYGISQQGLGINLLSDNAEPHKRENKLFYASASEVLRFFNKDLGARCLIDHSYSRWEFTALAFSV
jgi:SAM-dependent methyltransferase